MGIADAAQRRTSAPDPNGQAAVSGPRDEPRLAALRYRDFRLLWSGQLVSTTGSQMQMIAVNWHIYSLLRGTTMTVGLLGGPRSLDAAAFGLGLLGLVRVVPVVAFALFGGMLADVRDRRTVMIQAQTAAAVASGLLAAATLTGRDSLSLIYLLAAGGAAASAFDNPARQALVPRLVAPRHLTNAVSLNTLLWQIGTIVGPGLAGVLVARYQLGVVYAIDTVSFLAVLAALWKLEYRGAPAETGGMSLAAFREGLQFTYRSRIIWGTMLLDFFATFFASARTMLPIVAESVLGVGVRGYGLLATAQPVGAVLAGGIVALRKEIHDQGRVLLVSVALYGLATALFGLSTVFALSYVLFALTGAGDTVSTVIRGTVRQQMTPDRLRGRMTSVNMMFFMGGPQLGELEAGLVAAAFGAPLAIATGGLATILLTAWVAWKFPRLRNYTADEGRAAAAAVL
jgi:MFS family permease